MISAMSDKQIVTAILATWMSIVIAAIIVAAIAFACYLLIFRRDCLRGCAGSRSGPALV